MKFTESPRRWRKTLMYIALAQILKEDEGLARFNPLACGLFWGALVGTVLALPTAVVTILIQLAAAVFFRPTIPELICVLNKAAVCGAVIGWFVNWICVAGASEKYLRKRSRTAPLIYVEIPAAMIVAGVGLPSLLILFYSLLTLLHIPGATMPYAAKQLLPNEAACLLAAWPAVLMWNQFMILARRGEVHLQPLPHSKGLVPTAPRRRLLFRRGRGVMQPLPVHGPARNRVAPPRW